MKAIKNARVVLKDTVWEGCVLYEGQQIHAFTNAAPEGVDTIDARGCYLLPGLIDTHIHGCKGADVCDGTADALGVISGELIRHGVTRFLPTTLSQGDECLAGVFQAVAQFMGNEPGAGALGVHLEGPFINPLRAGAQNQEYISAPREELVDMANGLIRLITLAPEMAKYALITSIKRRGSQLSMGHTDATYEQACAGIKAGVTRATHCFNAMRPLNHTEPGAAGAALLCPIETELIADGLHVHRDICALLYVIKGPEKITLVSDSIRTAGMPYGRYIHGGMDVNYNENGARIPGGRLAGSTLTLEKAVSNMMQFCKVPIWEAVRMASYNPAKALGLDGLFGSIQPGHIADFVLANEDMNVLMTWRDGEVLFHSDALV